MLRGRPKKKATEPFKLVDAPKCQNDTLENGALGNTESNTKDIVGTTENNVETVKRRKSSISKQYPLCTRCGKPITNTNPFRVNLAYLTSVASYHREVKDDVPTLCNECAKGLSKAIDEYLLNGGAKRKFERE